MKRYPAGKAIRLKRSSDISRLFADGVRVADRRIMLVVQNRPDQPEAPTRVGVAVSKRHGNAVQRNRIKRLCREAFRLLRPDIPAGWDCMIVPRVGGEFTLEKLQKSIMKLFDRLIKKIANPADS